MGITESLTEREQQALEHMRKAQELGVTLKEYAAKNGLDVQMLYQLRKPLVREGALGPVRRPDPEPRRDKSNAFLPVHVVPSAAATGGTPMAWRLGGRSSSKTPFSLRSSSSPTNDLTRSSCWSGTVRPP
jgi:hypothetical protein